MTTCTTAYDFGHDIVRALENAGYHVDIVNSKVTPDSIVEHVVDLDVLGSFHMFNISVNINRICTREQYVEGDEANPPHPELAND